MMNGDSPSISKVLHLEVSLKTQARKSDKEGVAKAVEQYVRTHVKVVGGLQRIQDFGEDEPELSRLVSYVDLVRDENMDEAVVHVKDCQLLSHVFKLDRHGEQEEELEDSEEGVNAATQWVLPSQQLQGIWETLIYDGDVKQSLLSYVSASLLLSAFDIDPNVVSCNRVVLLHGPPGTGKTSLCRALAQKLSIRLSDRYAHAQLVEINSHSLFSKWFSESGKLVQKMFDMITQIVEDHRVLVFVLIDEVESLAAARKSNGSEPSDATRVVNALLTQIDKLRKHPNVLILTTSNITGCIDLAFVDRADIKKFVGLPSARAIYSMYLGSVNEFMSKGLLLLTHLPEAAALENSAENANSRRLFEISQESTSLSGRMIRKLPLLALAKIVQLKQPPFDLAFFLEGLQKAVAEEHSNRKELG